MSVAPGFSCSMWDQGSNLRPLHRQWILIHCATREIIDPFGGCRLYSDDSIKKLKKIKPKQVCLVKLSHKQVEI